ncbi:helicase associated domain-containing protein [Kitasatospora cathayae]|uniref:helicase associated domain-containing protein n=1 Tax=Kitasatospora cathayae TaxID=3004092 RepID=UPI0038601B5E
MHAVAAAFHLEHGHLDPTDKTEQGELVSWPDRQRYLNGQGLLDAARVSELDALGMIWSKHANAGERGYAYARAWAAHHGHLAIPSTEKLDGYAVGAVDAPPAQGRGPRRRPGGEAGRAGRAVAPEAGLEPLLPAPARLVRACGGPVVLRCVRRSRPRRPAGPPRSPGATSVRRRHHRGYARSDHRGRPAASSGLRRVSAGQEPFPGSR